MNGAADYLITFNLKDFGSTDKRFGYTLLTLGRFLQGYDQL